MKCYEDRVVELYRDYTKYDYDFLYKCTSILMHNFIGMGKMSVSEASCSFQKFYSYFKKTSQYKQCGSNKTNDLFGCAYKILGLANTNDRINKINNVLVFHAYIVYQLVNKGMKYDNSLMISDTAVSVCKDEIENNYNYRALYLMINGEF